MTNSTMGRVLSGAVGALFTMLFALPGDAAPTVFDPPVRVGVAASPAQYDPYAYRRPYSYGYRPAYGYGPYGRPYGYFQSPGARFSRYNDRRIRCDKNPIHC